MTSEPEAPESLSRPVFAALLIAATAIAAFQVRSFWAYAQDDAFITFAYARHWIETGRALYRPDETVIGYSNPLWMAISAAMYAALGADRILVAMRAVSFLALVSLCVTTPLAARRLGARRVAQAACVLLPALTTAFALHVNSGLETVLETALVSFAAWRLLPDDEGRIDALSGLLALALAAIARFDGMFPFALGLTYVAWNGWRRKDMRSAVAILAALAIYGVYVDATFAAYGIWTPNTVVAKMSAAYPASVRLAEGVRYLHGADQALGLRFLVSGFLLLLWYRRDLAVLFCAALAALFLAKSVAVGGDAMMGFRFVAPALPVMFALAAAGFSNLWVNHPKVGAVGVVVLTAACVVSLQWIAPAQPEAVTQVKKARFNAELVAGYIDIARAFEPFCREGDELATDVAGTFAFFTNCRVLDTWGLNSAEIARRGRAPDGVRFTSFGVVAPEVALERKARYILPYPPVPMPRAWPREKALASVFPAPFYVNRREMAEYDLVAVKTPRGVFSFFQRRQIPES
ncbi:MAG: hypothetical protein IT350_20715 [Deltaproteobacteria bacterium]|nr:hypothetical protein [Deltaproteobacteria bacterium]